MQLRLTPHIIAIGCLELLLSGESAIEKSVSLICTEATSKVAFAFQFLPLTDTVFLLAVLTFQVHHFCHLDEPPEPTPLVTPPQSSDDEEAVRTLSLSPPPERTDSLLRGRVRRACLQDVCPYLSPAASPPQTLGIGALSPRKQPRHPPFSAPEGPATLSCHLPPYMNTEHAQSWPSINVSRKQWHRIT